MAGASIDIGVVMHGFGAANETLGVLKQSFDGLGESARNFRETLSPRDFKALERQVRETGVVFATFASKYLRDTTRGFVNAAKEMQQFEVMLKTVTGSSLLAAKRLEHLKKVKYQFQLMG